MGFDVRAEPIAVAVAAGRRPDGGAQVGHAAAGPRHVPGVLRDGPAGAVGGAGRGRSGHRGGVGVDSPAGPHEDGSPGCDSARTRRGYPSPR